MRTIQTLLLVLYFTGISAQNQNCDPVRGLPTTCDSVYNLCRIDAYFLTMISVSKPTSKWYDSLHYPEELMFNYTNAMIALYNDLPDSLADFRSYHYFTHHPRYFHPDSTFTIYVDLPYRALDSVQQRTSSSGMRRVDSLMLAAGMQYEGKDLLASLDVRVRYKCPPDVNRGFVERQLHSIDKGIEMTPVYRYCPFQHILEGDEGPDRYSIIIQEVYKCMPPELPCVYIRRTFYYQHERGARYGKFERGTVPWPNKCME